MRVRTLEQLESSCEVTLDGCWIWQGKCNKFDRPVIWQDGKLRSGRRVAWSLKHGKRPDRLVFSGCGEDKCLNPEHLVLRLNRKGRYHARIRPCMQCDAEMYSTGPHHRHCDTCRARLEAGLPAVDEMQGVSELRKISPAYLKGRKDHDFDK